jgi:hypothetical protein
MYDIKKQPYQLEAAGSCDIFLKGDTALDRLDFVEINTNLDTCDRHILSSNLQPLFYIK